MNSDALEPALSRKFLTVSNLLSIARAILVVPFILVMLSGIPSSRFWGIVILLVAALTDRYDGIIARKYHQETQWGRILDPLADKLGIMAGGVVLLILDLVPLWFVASLVARDALILSGGVYIKAKTGLILPSHLSGKWAVGVFSLTILVILLEAPAVVVTACIWSSVVMLIVSLGFYVRRFAEVLRPSAREGSRGGV